MALTHSLTHLFTSNHSYLTLFLSEIVQSQTSPCISLGRSNGRLFLDFLPHSFFLVKRFHIKVRKLSVNIKIKSEVNFANSIGQNKNAYSKKEIYHDIFQSMYKNH